MRKTAIVLVSTAVALLVVGSSPEPVSGSPLLTNPFVEPQPPPPCGHCHPATCGGPGHDFHEQDPKDKSGTDHECYNWECSQSVHPNCGAGDDLSVEAADSLARETKEMLGLLSQKTFDAKSLTRLVQLNRQRLSYNRERGRLQISSGCSPEVVIAQIALRETDFLAATATEQVGKN